MSNYGTVRVIDFVFDSDLIDAVVLTEMDFDALNNDTDVSSEWFWGTNKLLGIDCYVNFSLFFHDILKVVSGEPLFISGYK